MDGSNAGKGKPTASPDGSTNDLAPREQLYRSDHSSSVSSIDTTELLNTTDADREHIADPRSQDHYVGASSQLPGQPSSMTMPDRSAGTQQTSSSIIPTESRERPASDVLEPSALSDHPRSLDTPFQALPKSEPPALVRTPRAYPQESGSQAWGHLLAAEAASRRLTAAIDPSTPPTHNPLNPQAPSFIPARQAHQETPQQEQQVPPKQHSFSSIND